MAVETKSKINSLLMNILPGGIIFSETLKKQGYSDQLMKQYRKSGTRFYGFQIGIEPTEWDKYMDKIYKIYYKIPSRF